MWKMRNKFYKKLMSYCYVLNFWTSARRKNEINVFRLAYRYGRVNTIRKRLPRFILNMQLYSVRFFNNISWPGTNVITRCFLRLKPITTKNELLPLQLDQEMAVYGWMDEYDSHHAVNNKKAIKSQ